MADDIPKTQVFCFDHGTKALDNCSWEELRTVIDYLADENERLRMWRDTDSRINAYYGRVDDKIRRTEERYPPYFALSIVYTVIVIGVTVILLW